MKITVNRKEPEYPYLGITNKGLVVLFVTRLTGTVLESGCASHLVGAVSDTWESSAFSRMEKGEGVTLCN